MKQLLSMIFITTTFMVSVAQQSKGEGSMKKQALIVVTSCGKMGNSGKKTGWYLSEVTHVYYPLLDAGFVIDFASPQGGAAPMDEGSRKLDDKENMRFLEDKVALSKIQNTLPLAQVDARTYQVVHFAGGHGTMWDFPDDAHLSRIASMIYEQGGVVSAVCHGPAALVNVKLSNGDYLVKGKDVNSFTDAEELEVGLATVVPFSLESKLKERGGKFRRGPNWSDTAVVSERLVTGQNPQSARSVGRKVLEMVRVKGH